MKKRILSLILVMAMLLSVVPMIGAAEETPDLGVWAGRSLTLSSGIAINFVTAEAVEDFGRVDFEVDGQVVQRYSTAKDGQKSFAFTRLTPSTLGKNVTAKMYNTAGEVIGEVTTNVLSYCQAALAGDNAALKKLCVDLLNYAAATQTYVGSTDAAVNAELTDDQKALGTSAYFPVKLATDLAFHDYGTATSADWYGAGLILNDTITMRLQYTTETPDTYVAVVVSGERVAELKSKLVDEEQNLYEVYYNGLKPSEFSVGRQFLICQADGTRISKRLTYSMESFAYAVKNNPTTYAKEVALVEALTDYCRSACALNGHSFTNGICATCGVEMVYAMDSESITVPAVDAVLDTNYVSKSGTMVKLTNDHNGSQKTVSEQAGDLIVYVTPKVSGEYKIQVKGNYTKGSDYGYYTAVTDDTTEDAAYERVYLPDDYNTAEITTTTFGSKTDAKLYQWTAGKTYAIHVSASSTKASLYEFVITKQQEEPEHTEHTYTNGVCECGKERVFEVNGDTTIQAEDAILNLTGDQSGAELKLLENPNAGGGKLVLSQKVYSTYAGVNAATVPGNIIVKFTPAATGTYYIHAKVLDNGGALGAMVAEAGDTTTAYARAPITDEDNISKFDYTFIQSTADFTWGQIGSGYELEAGKTYAIRILCNTTNLAFDEFVISTSNATPS